MPENLSTNPKTSSTFQNNPQAEARYAKLKSEFSDKMLFHFERFNRGQITVDQLHNFLEAVIKDFYPQAFQLGLEIGEANFTMGKWDKNFYIEAIKEELENLQEFITDIKNRHKVKSSDKRLLQRFIDYLDGIKNSGFLSHYLTMY